MTIERGAASGYDPIPDLAALIDGLQRMALTGIRDRGAVLGELFTGPYARLRGGLLLDFENAHLTTEDSIRAVLIRKVDPQHWVNRP